MSRFQEQLAKMRNASGFIAALDQSGGSTPKALRLYGIADDAWSTDAEMFELVHAMRTRIITAEVFDGERILGAILFEDTLNRQMSGQSTASYLWEVKHVVPFLKIDKGLAALENGVQLMKPIPGLIELLPRAKAAGVFGTKMRSVIQQANPDGIGSVVAQQFEVARVILEAGLVPIIEPEVDIHCPDKALAEAQLKEHLLKALDSLAEGQEVMLKLTLPEEDNFHAECVAHPRVLRVVALSGGYSRAEANERLRRNPDVVASFSRALTEGLSVEQSDEEFNARLDDAIQSIYEASMS